MSYITPAQFKSGLQETKDYVDEKVAGVSGDPGGSDFTKAYIIGTDPFHVDWLSLTEGGTPIVPEVQSKYMIVSSGDYQQQLVYWDGHFYRLLGQKVNKVKTQSEITMQNPVESGLVFTRYTDSSPSVSFVIEPFTKHIRYVAIFDGNSYYDPNNWRIGFQDDYEEKSGQIGVMDQSTRRITTDQTFSVTEDDWGKTFYIACALIHSDGSVRSRILDNRIIVTKEWDIDSNIFIPVTDEQDGQSGLIPSIQKDSTAEAFTPKGWGDVDFNVTPEEIRHEFVKHAGAGRGGGNPVGTIISFMGVFAPSGYLACDGGVHNIADYSMLAEFFEVQFGSKNNFGGDGVTTFGVPDLRGEFLRGAGNNGHENQGNGENIGVHQDGSFIYNSFVSGNQLVTKNNNGFLLGQGDSSYVRATNIRIAINSSSDSGENTVSTLRPTNTSVLYCIKY